jgi:hypothetical protein
MHQTFWFRVAVPKDADPEELAISARESLEEYINRYGDENNWYQEEMLLLSDGTVVELCAEDDYRGRSDLAEHYLCLPPEDRWNRAIHSATLSVALDLEIGGSNGLWIGDPPEETKRVLAQTTEQLTQAILRDTPRRLVQLYEDVIAGLEQERWAGERGYTRRKVARIFETFHQATHKPFAAAMSPYDYPCFDLVEPLEVPQQVALLAVDIHT